MGLFEKKEFNDEVVLTTEVVASGEKVLSEKNRAVREKQQEQAKALVRICEYATKNNLTEIIDDLKILRPSFFGLGGLSNLGSDGMTYINKLLKLVGKNDFDELSIGDNFTSMEIFKNYGYGTSEATIFIRDLVQKPPKKDTEKRVWLVRKSTADRGIIYEICGIGTERPAEFVGKFDY